MAETAKSLPNPGMRRLTSNSRVSLPDIVCLENALELRSSRSYFIRGIPVSLPGMLCDYICILRISVSFVKINNSSTALVALFLLDATDLDDDKLVRIAIPHLNLEVPFRICRPLLRLGMLGLTATPNHNQRVAGSLRAGGSKIAASFHKEANHIGHL